ncbi:MAG: hypothetical protein HY303_14520, partial [Candidatus Wallbacteria bacterium]|nr:hypothetical protein [Candidatus Wallbacteria bacterium]
GYDYYSLELPAGAEIAALTARLLETLAVIDLEMSDPDLDLVMRAVYADASKKSDSIGMESPA